VEAVRNSGLHIDQKNVPIVFLRYFLNDNKLGNFLLNDDNCRHGEARTNMLRLGGSLLSA